jgi:hypothetical protein
VREEDSNYHLVIKGGSLVGHAAYKRGYIVKSPTPELKLILVRKYCQPVSPSIIETPMASMGHREVIWSSHHSGMTITLLGRTTLGFISCLPLFFSCIFFMSDRDRRSTIEVLGLAT